MSPNYQSLSDLPVVVLDCIFENFNRFDLASLSLTCRCLYHVSLKYLYRGLTFGAHNICSYHEVRVHKKFDKYEASLQCNPALIRYIHSYVSRSRPFLQWMYSQANPPSLEWLELEWSSSEAILERMGPRYSKFATMLPIPPRYCIHELIFNEINLEFDGAVLSSLSSFRNICFLELQTADCPSLQSLLEQIYALSLERLVVSDIEDWRIQWHPSFEEALSNLRGLHVITTSEVDTSWVMFDHLDPEGPIDESTWASSNVMWDSLLIWYRQSLFFWITLRFLNNNSTDLFLDFAPQYAKIHQLNPILLIQWRLKSVETFSGVHISIKTAMTPEDIMIVFHTVTSITLRGFDYVSVVLPLGITSAIASLLPKSITDLHFTLHDTGILQLSILPVCICSLPKLKCLEICVTLSKAISNHAIDSLSLSAVLRRSHGMWELW